MARSKHRKKKKKTGGRPGQSKGLLTPQKYIQTRARKLPFHKCYVNDSWVDQGMAVVFISRMQPSDKITFGIYMVDTFCLGLKNTYCQMNQEIDFIEDEYIPERAYKDMEYAECTPEFAQSIIYGGINYAKDLGFKPHKDFRLSKFVLDDAQNMELMDLEFGRDGMPTYINGPFEDETFVVNTLNKTVGEDNYDVVYLDENGQMISDDEEEAYGNTGEEGGFDMEDLTNQFKKMLEDQGITEEDMKKMQEEMAKADKAEDEALVEETADKKRND